MDPAQGRPDPGTGLDPLLALSTEHRTAAESGAARGGSAEGSEATPAYGNPAGEAGSAAAYGGPADAPPPTDYGAAPAGDRWQDELSPPPTRAGPGRAWPEEPRLSGEQEENRPGTGPEPTPWAAASGELPAETSAEPETDRWRDELSPAPQASSPAWEAQPEAEPPSAGPVPPFSADRWNDELSPAPPAERNALSGEHEHPDGERNEFAAASTGPPAAESGPAEAESPLVPAEYGPETEEEEPEPPQPAGPLSEEERERDPITAEFPGFDDRPPGDESDRQYPGYDALDYLPETANLAKLTLVLGLFAVLLPPFGVILGGIALVTAPKARRSIRESQGGLEGGNLVAIGTVLGLIGIALGLGVVLLGIVVLLI